MDTRIVYATSHDGVGVACSVQGNGFPLIYTSVPIFSNCRLPAPTEAQRRFWLRISERHTLIKLDFRGSGLADRHPPTQAVEDYIHDILAIYEALRLDRADVFSLGLRNPVVLRFAAEHPERVRRLILFGGTAGPGGADGFAMALPAARRLILDDWDLFLATHASRTASSENAVPVIVEWMRQCSDQADVLAYMECMAQTDLRGLPERVECPTLIAELDGTTLREKGRAEKLAAVMPHCELVFLPNKPLFGWADDFAEAMERFDARLDAAEGRSAAQQLSPRETEVLRLLASGHTNAEIASALTVSRATVDRHVANIYAKLGVRNRAEATRWALTHGLGDRS